VALPKRRPILVFLGSDAIMKQQQEILTRLDKLCDLLSLNLGNCIVNAPEEGDFTVPNNSSKIRRHIKVNNVDMWVCANSEQEYAENVGRLLSGQTLSKSCSKTEFQFYADNWFHTFSEPNISKVTAISYKRQLHLHIYPVIGNKIMEEITVADIQEVFNSMSSDTKQSTKNKTKNVLNQIFKAAYEDKLIDRNPMDSPSLKIKGQDSDATKPYSVEQMRYLATNLNKVKDKYDKAWLALSICLPLRPEEVLGLQWKNVDLKNNIIHIRTTVSHPTRNEPYFCEGTKTSSSKRDLRISQEMIQYLPLKGRADEFVVGGEKPLSYTQLRSMRKRIKRDTGFSEPITPRRFRTTVATDISAITHDLKLVQKMLGHTTPQMTLKYYDKGRNTSTDATEAISKCYQFDRLRD